MDLNIIDFNNFLRKDKRSLYCIYRNLQMGHKVYVHNEKSKTLKSIMATAEYQKYFKNWKTFFSIKYEYLKLSLFERVEGFFIEADQIVYTPEINIDKNKTYPFIYRYHDLRVLSLCSWAPQYISHNMLTLNYIKFFKKRLISLLPVYEDESFLSHTYMQEMTYQIISILKPIPGTSLKQCVEDFGFGYFDKLESTHFSEWQINHFKPSDYIKSPDILYMIYIAAPEMLSQKLIDKLIDKDLCDSLSYEKLLEMGMIEVD